MVHPTGRTTRSTSKRKFTEAESITMLSEKEIAYFCDDGFEGSSNERQIFIEVFYGNEKGHKSKRCVVTSAIHFEADQTPQCMPSNAMFHSNCENSTISSLSSMKESPRDDAGTINQILGRKSTKRMKSSGEFLENKEPACCLLESSKDLVPLESSTEAASNAVALGTYCTSNTIACHLVESSGVGIISSCILLKDHGNLNAACGLDEEKRLDKMKLVWSFTRDSKKGTEFKDVNSPVSQESSAPKNFSRGKVVSVEGHPLSLPSMDAEELQDSDLLKSNYANFVWKRDFIKKLRPRLHEHVKHILLSAGFEIELRKKKKMNSSMDTVYLTPSMKVIFSLPLAWRSCGKSLFSGEIYSMLDENGREWSDIIDFWCNLSDTLAYIEKEMRKKSSISLQQRWILLDPFVTVLIIDKKVSVLTAGRPVKAIRGVSVELHKNQGMILAADSSKGGGNYGAMIVGGKNHDQRNSWHVSSLNEGVVLDSGSDSSVELVNVHLSDNTVAVEAVAEGFGDVYNHQNLNGKTFISTAENSNEKLFFNGDLGNINLENLAMRVENGSTDASILGIMSQNLLAGQLMMASISTAHSAIPEDSHSKHFLSEYGLAQGQSKNQVMDVPGCVSMCSTCECRIEGELMPPDSYAEIDAMAAPATEGQTCGDMLNVEHNQFCKELVTQMQMPCVHYEKETLNHELGQGCKNDAHAFDSSMAVVPEIAMAPEVQSSACQGSSCRDISSFGERQMDLVGLKPSGHPEEQPLSAFKASPMRDICAEAPGTDLTIETGSTQASKMRCKHKKGVPHTAKLFSSQCSNFVNFYCGQEMSQCNSIRRREVCHSLESSQPNVNLSIDDQQFVEVKVEQQIPFPYKSEKLCNETNDLNLTSVEQKPASSGTESLSAGLKHFEFQDELDIALQTSKAQQGSGMSNSQTEMILTKRMQKKSKKISEIKSPNAVGELNEVDVPLLQVVGSQSINFRNLEEDYDDSSHGCLKSQKESLASCKKENHKACIGCSSQHQLANLTKLNKFQNLFDFLESDSMTQDHKSKMKLRCNNYLDEASLTNDEQLALCSGRNYFRMKPSDTSATRKTVKARKSEFFHENRRKKMQQCLNDDDDLLISAILRNKNFSSKRKHIQKRSKYRSKVARMLKSQSGSCRLLLRSPGKGGNLSMDGKWFSRARTVLAWLVDAGVLYINDVIQYRSPMDDKVIKSGQVTRDGVLCKCCQKKFSLSEFKIHAGFKLGRSFLNLSLDSGEPLTVYQLQAWASEYKARKGARIQVQTNEMDQSDDTCGRCGDGGELICCDNCPSTFHQSCLSSQEFPDGDWYCPNCTCEICGNVVNEKEASSSLTALQCSQCENKYHKTCMNQNGICQKVRSGTWFCMGSCKEVYLGLHSRMGVPNKIADGFSWTLLRCNHGDQKIHSAQRIALIAECNTKLAVALNIMEESFLPMVDPRTGIDMIPHVLYSWGSDFTRLNYQSFYTVILEKGDELVSVASIRVHGVRLAEMPLIATCSEHRRQGMCRRLMNAIEEMLNSFKVEMLVLTAIPALVETWTTGFGFEPMSNKEKEQLTRINLMTFPGTILLKKTLYHVETMETIDGLESVSMRSIELKEGGASGKNAAVDPGLQCVGIDLEAKPLGPVPPNSVAHPSKECNKQKKQDSCGRRPISVPLEINHSDISNIDHCDLGQATLDTFDDFYAVVTEKADCERSCVKAMGEEICNNLSFVDFQKAVVDSSIAKLSEMTLDKNQTDFTGSQKMISCGSAFLGASDNSCGGEVEEKGAAGIHDVRM